MAPPPSAASATTAGTPNYSLTATNCSTSGVSVPASSSGNGLSPGHVVGVGIGCAFVGALLAGLIVFLLVRRKRQQPAYPQQHLPPNLGGYAGQEKYGMVPTSSEVKGAVVTNVDRLLPQPAEDDAIVGGLSKIRDAIKNHVQNYYDKSPVSPELVDETSFIELANATGIPTSALLGLLLNPATRTPTIRLFLGHLILSRCQGRTDGQPSLLPNEVSGLAASNSGTNSSRLALFSKWKTISGALLQQRYGQHGENDPRDHSIAQILAEAEPVLHPFISSNIDIRARQRNLEAILRRASQFAFLLFSQPGSFIFDYNGRGGPDSLLVFPALLQTVSDEAVALLTPRVMSESEVLAGLGA